MHGAGKRAILDGLFSLLGFAGVAILLVSLTDSREAVNAAAFVTGLTLVAGAVASVVRRRPSFSGPADRVTLLRAVLAGGCATLIVLALWGSVPLRSWWLIVLAVPALLLDAVDGLVARRTGTASADGARLDMETDAILLLVLSVPAALTVGWWAALIGLMRYLFVAASWWRPALRAPLEFSQFRRVTAALQGAALAVALAPFVPVALATAVLAAALALLGASFGRDIVHLERASSRAAPQRGEPVLPGSG